MEEKIHIWQFPLRTAYIKIERNFRQNIVQNAINRSGSCAKLAEYVNYKSANYGIHSGYGGSNTHEWKFGKKMDGMRREPFVPLWVFLECICLNCEKVSESYDMVKRLEANILAYKELEMGNPITPRYLPIKVNPELDSIVFHLLGDGCFGGKGRCSSYKQKNVVGRENFLMKLRNIFGNFDLNEKEYEENWKVCIPSIITRIIEKHYGIESREKKRVPRKIMQKGKESKLAGLAAFIVDEGHVGDSIEMYASNEELLNQIRDICVFLQYPCSQVLLKAKAGYRKHKLDHFRLRISLNAVEKIESDINELRKRYPTCYLAQKQGLLERIVKRRAAPHKGMNGETRGKILAYLEKPKTAKQLGEILNVGGQTVREHLEILEKSGRIRRSGKTTNSILWLAQKSESLF
ncbi:MAG: winged helix-turn-helix domain-containing protein [Candidatus Micrarchaeota archaeon]